jgi:hypothetical protein
MRFFCRHAHFFLIFAILGLASVLVIQQFLANQSAHVEAREDFIVLHEKGHLKIAEHRYQLLIQSLPKVSERDLWEDYQRTAMLVDGRTPQLDNLIWKYHVSVKNELNKRIERRVERAVERAEK